MKAHSKFTRNKMSSDGSIKVNNLLGTFELNGPNSNLQNDDNIFMENTLVEFFQIRWKKTIKQT